MFDNQNFNDLETKGFIVLREFLSSDEIDFLMNDYRSQEPAENTNYVVTEANDVAFLKVREKLSDVLSSVKQSTRIKADISALHVGYYFASEEVSFGWHQDHESYFELQDHYNYLNFFMPVHKPIKEKGNLKVIPWDEVKKLSEETHDRLLGTGAGITHTIGDKTYVTQVSGLKGEIPVDIEKISATPHLDAGDLLLFRGDTIHRTQDADTNRVALSFRFTDPDALLSRKTLLTGSERKTNMMLNNWHDFGPMIKAFQLSKKETLTWKNLQQELKKIDASSYEPPKGIRRKIILSDIWAQRLTTGSFFPSLKCQSEYKKSLKFIDSVR